MTHLETVLPHPTPAAGRQPTHARGGAACPGLWSALVAALALTVPACGGMADETGPDGGVEDQSPGDPDAGDQEPGGCDEGYQDANGDGVCRPSCEATGDLALDCGSFATCAIDAEGERFCQCDEHHAGVDCASCVAGYELGDDGCQLYTPSDENLVLWLDATTKVVTPIGGTSTEVLMWLDRRELDSPLSLAPHVSEARPDWIEDGLNGRPVVRFDGNDRLSDATFPGLRGADYTVIVVFNPTSMTPHGLVAAISNEHGTGFGLERADGMSTYRASHKAPYAVGDGDVVTVVAGEALSPKLLIARRWTSGLIDHVRLTANNGDGLAGASALASAGQGDLAIGHEFRVGGAGVQGDFAEILVYDRAVADDELEDIMAYLAAKWGM